MKQSAIAAGAALVLGLGSAMTLAASAATTSNTIAQTYQLNTVEASEESAGEVDGAMRLIVSPDGTIEGTYRTKYDGPITPENVTGGVEPNGQVWLEIGNGVPSRRLIGTFRDGVLHTTYQKPGSNDETVHFDAAVGR